MRHVIVNEVVSSNPWNNPFGVDDLFMEKQVAWFAQTKTETVPESNFK